jgi:hypothetical protein
MFENSDMTKNSQCDPGFVGRRHDPNANRTELT